MDIISQLETLKSLADAITELSHDTTVVNLAFIMENEIEDVTEKVDAALAALK